MSIETNKALVRRLYELVNQGDLSIVDTCVSPTFTDRNPAPGAPEIIGAEGFKQFLIARQAGFPDGQNTIDLLLAEGDKVVVRDTFEGTHQGTFFGIAPTGKRIKVTHIYIWRIEDGQIIENWDEGASWSEQLR